MAWSAPGSSGLQLSTQPDVMRALWCQVIWASIWTPKRTVRWETPALIAVLVTEARTSLA